MNAVKCIKQYLAKIPEGQPFPSRDLRQFATTENVRKILSRMVKAGELRRAARGIFIKPCFSKHLGELTPSTEVVVKTLLKSTGETIAVHGAEAARKLQLSTQVPVRLIFYTSGNTRTLKIGNQIVKLKHINPSRIIAPGTIPGLVISALYYLERRNVTTKTIEKIKNLLRPEDFNKTLNLIQNMPAWMADVFYHYQQTQKGK
jgi:hypothetical protein